VVAHYGIIANLNAEKPRELAKPVENPSLPVAIIPKSRQDFPGWHREATLTDAVLPPKAEDDKKWSWPGTGLAPPWLPDFPQQAEVRFLRDRGVTRASPLTLLGRVDKMVNENAGDPEGRTMPRTKQRPLNPPASEKAAPNGIGETPEVLTLEEAASYFRVPADAVLRMIDAEGLPARQFGA
jgi:hypothetical protein